MSGDLVAFLRRCINEDQRRWDARGWPRGCPGEVPKMVAVFRTVLDEYERVAAARARIISPVRDLDAACKAGQRVALGRVLQEIACSVYADRDGFDPAWKVAPWDTVSNDDYSCCALAETHDGPCRWKCSDCGTTGRCLACGGDGEDGSGLPYTCIECGGSGRCTAGCEGGWQTEDVLL